MNYTNRITDDIEFSNIPFIFIINRFIININIRFIFIIIL